MRLSSEKQEKHSTLYSSGVWKVLDQGPGNMAFGEDCFYFLGGHIHAAFSHGERGEGALWDLLHRAPTHSSELHPCDLTSQTITLGIRFQHTNWGGRTQKCSLWEHGYKSKA